MSLTIPPWACFQAYSRPRRHSAARPGYRLDMYLSIQSWLPHEGLEVADALALAGAEAVLLPLGAGEDGAAVGIAVG